jgi:hypothetical protein
MPLESSDALFNKQQETTKLLHHHRSPKLPFGQLQRGAPQSLHPYLSNASHVNRPPSDDAFAHVGSLSPSTARAHAYTFPETFAWIRLTFFSCSSAMLLKYSEVCVWAVGVPVVQGRGGEAGPVLSHLDFGGESLPTIFGSTTTSAEGSKRFRCEGDSSPLYLCSACIRTLEQVNCSFINHHHYR